MALNTFYLFWLTGYPFACALIMTYEFDSYLTVEEGGWVPWTVHAFLTFMAGLAQYGLVLYLHFSSDANSAPGSSRRMLLVSFTYFAISTSGCVTVVVLSFIQPSYAIFGYVLVPVLFAIMRLFRNRLLPEYRNELGPEEKEEHAQSPSANNLTHDASLSTERIGSKSHEQEATIMYVACTSFDR